MNTILCPTDFSDNANCAAEYACAIGEKFSSKIILLHVYESPAAFTDTELAMAHDVEIMLKETSSKKLEALRKKMIKKFPKVSLETQLESGAGHVQMISSAKNNDVDIIIMGVTGSSKLERMLMGSTTSRVIQHAGCPVLCIPKEGKYNDIKKIVFATDLHEDNISSAMTIAPFAMKFGAEIVFVFVDDKHLIHSDSEITSMTKKIRSQVKYPKISGYISKNTSITRGIEYFLKKYPADMLVMFTHHKHFPGRIFNQSITKLMSYQTKIPLLALEREDRPLV